MNDQSSLMHAVYGYSQPTRTSVSGQAEVTTLAGGRGGVESEQWRNPQPTTQATIVHHPSTRPQTDFHDQLRQLDVVYSAYQSTAGQWRTLGNIQK